jgi:hypothetical protein
MKFLNDERIEIEDGEVKITMRPVTTSQQARLGDLNLASGITGHIDLAKYCLKTCIEKISISDISYDPITLADKSDISDEATLSVMTKVGRMVTLASFVKGEDLKK